MRTVFIAIGLAAVVCVGSHASPDFITVPAYHGGNTEERDKGQTGPAANDLQLSMDAELAELTIAAEEAERFTAALDDGLGNAMSEYCRHVENVNSQVRLKRQ